jgi:hypothetical protein
MSSFTPGPWILRYANRVTRADDMDGTKSIAHVYECREQNANLRLIAAAPDMYEAIANSDDAHWTPAMRAAIAKAEGTA